MIRDFLASDISVIKAFFTETHVFNENEINCLDEDLSLYLEGHYVGDRILVSGEAKANGIIHYGPLPITDRTWCLHWIGVDPKTQTKGIGSTLVDAMEADVCQQKGRIILIETSSRDIYAKTRAFYLKHGYRLATQIPDFYAEGDDKCIFLKKF